MFRVIITATIVIVLGSVVVSQEAQNNSSAIDEATLKAHVKFLSDDKSKEWGAEQFRAYNTAHYHQPSDELRDTWDFRALIQSAEIGLAIGRMISDLPEKPRFNPGDEFAKP